MKVRSLGLDIHSDCFAQCCTRNNRPTSARIGPARLLEASPCLLVGGAAAGWHAIHHAMYTIHHLMQVSGVSC